MNNLWLLGIGFAYIAVSIPFWLILNRQNIKKKEEFSFIVKSEIAIAIIFEILGIFEYFGIEGKLLLLAQALLLTVPIFSIYEVLKRRKENEMFKEGV